MLARFFAYAAALGVATYLVEGITLGGTTTESKIVTILAVALIFMVVNSLLKPLFTLVSAPLVLLSLGLFLLVINAALLLITSWLSTMFGLAWQVDGWGPAIFGGLIVSVVSFIANGILGRNREAG